MPYYISVKSFKRIARCIPTKFHQDPKCGTLKGTPVNQISDAVMINKYLSPCRCVTLLPEGYVTPSRPTEPRTDPTKIDHNLAGVATATNGNCRNVFPYKEVITLWHCSDGRDFATENEALWYELELTKHKLNDSRPWTKGKPDTTSKL